MTPHLLEALLAARAKRRAALVVTRLADGAQHLRLDAEPPGSGSADQVPGLDTIAATVLANGQSGVHQIAGEEWFLHAHLPTPRLLLVGAVHVAQALVRLAAAIGFEVMVIDPRMGLATTERFPGTTLLTLWPDEALAAAPPDRHTALVTLSHEARLDDPALDAGLRSPAFYIGALGSRRTQAARRERLMALGHDETALRRLHGPVGLPIGAIGPEEIALSIISELVAVRRGARDGLADRRAGG